MNYVNYDIVKSYLVEIDIKNYCRQYGMLEDTMKCEKCFINNFGLCLKYLANMDILSMLK